MMDLHINHGLVDRVKKDYIDRFGKPPQVILRSPGRINLIGEHTDYNQGFVLPSAVDLGIYIALGPSPDCTHRWHAIDLEEYVEMGSDKLGLLHDDWSDFPQGAWLALKERHEDLPYFQMSLSADLPVASGMSSSSALTCGVLSGINALFDCGHAREEIPHIAYQVERGFIGLRGGIMDQYSSVLSEPGQLLLLDCRSNTHVTVPFAEAGHLFLIHTNVQRSLTGSDYNSRSDECALAVKQLQDVKSIESLRDIEFDELEANQDNMDPVAYKRAHYVLEENDRLHACVTALKAGNRDRIGSLLYEGHAGLRDEFEVSIPELDLLVDLTRDEEWIYGARMMGGGFGGCTINLASKPPSNAFKQKVTEAYRSAFGHDPTFIEIRLTGGTLIIEPDQT